MSAILVQGRNVYVGGHFALADDLFVAGTLPQYVSGEYQGMHHVARWDGEQWHALGHEIDGVVFDLAVDGTTVYATGWFREPGRYVARWDGERWEAMGSGTDFYPISVAARDGEVYLGGVFSYAGGKPSFGIAHWSDTQTGVGTEAPQPNADAVRASIFPNPFSSTATIRFSLDAPSRVRVSVYDVLGREVALLADGWFSSGACGGRLMQTQHMVLLK